MVLPVCGLTIKTKREEGRAMKKLCFFLAVSILAAGGAHGMDMSNHIGFGARIGGIMPLNGGINADKDLSDVVGFYGFPAVEIKYVVMDKVAVGINGGYGYMPIKDEEKPSGYEDITPAFNVPFVALNGTFNFGPMMKAEDNKLNPFLTAGAGMYMWFFARNERTDKILADELIPGAKADEELKATSFGFNLGGGVEYFAAEKLAVFGRVNYHMLMTKDEDKFGDDFGNHGFLTFGAGVTYYLFAGSE
jgi:opacity protein-like surface antigen